MKNALQNSLLSTFLSFGMLSAGEEVAKPNVLFLFTDDQNAELVHALGNPHIHTPNVDRLVREGTAFTNAYIMGASSPGVCLPSRAMLLTGRSLWNIENQGIWSYEISEQFKTLPEVFRAGGHLTFVVGKNDPVVLAFVVVEVARITSFGIRAGRADRLGHPLVFAPDVLVRKFRFQSGIAERPTRCVSIALFVFGAFTRSRPPPVEDRQLGD